MTFLLKEKQLKDFGCYLKNEEKSNATIEKYLRDVKCFFSFVKEKRIEKSHVLSYKEHLISDYAVSSANSMLAALNAFFRFVDAAFLCVKQFKQQRDAFRTAEKELTREEYNRLVRAAESEKNTRLSLLLQTICGTGIRISELAFVTVEAAAKGETSVNCKGKIRHIFLVSALRKKLLRYAHSQGITHGPIFRSKCGAPLNRSNVWREMKALCRSAGVSPTKVFPHNLRHLFARVFYSIEKDIAKLADLLGHTSINTTRIYIASCAGEHKKHMETMRLVL
ncbi:MAG: tyrosine-type recombinase/integrase [Clostridia bacterium]|nr:tyrosine-type recombinase/integrase [Clostridia bacterium]